MSTDTPTPSAVLATAADRLERVLCAICGSGRYCWIHDTNRPAARAILASPTPESAA